MGEELLLITLVIEKHVMTISLLLYERAVCLLDWFEGRIRVLLCLVIGVDFKA